MSLVHNGSPSCSIENGDSEDRLHKMEIHSLKSSESVLHFDSRDSHQIRLLSSQKHQRMLDYELWSYMQIAQTLSKLVM